MPNGWSPFKSHGEFELADFLYRKKQMSTGKIDELCSLMVSIYRDHNPPFKAHAELYKTIDSISYGDAPWQSFAVKYSGMLPADPPAWMTAEYDVHMYGIAIHWSYLSTNLPIRTLTAV